LEVCLVLIVLLLLRAEVMLLRHVD
jgi:hypothetical protein